MNKLKNVIQEYPDWSDLNIYINRIESHIEIDFSHSLENAKALLETIGKEICKKNGVELINTSSINGVLKNCFLSLGFSNASMVQQISGSLATIGQQVGNLRNEIGLTSHGKSLEEITDLFQHILVEKDIVEDWDKVKKVVGLVRERANFVNEIWDQSSFFFQAPQEYDATAVKKRWKADSPTHMLSLVTLLEKSDDFSAAHTEYLVKNLIEEKEWGMGAVMNAFRLSIVGELKGPHMFDITEVIGKDATIARLKKAVEVIGEK